MKISIAICVATCGLWLTACTSGEHSVRGTVAEASVSSLSVALPSGDTVTFDAAHADRSEARRIIRGASVEVFYNGTLGKTPKATRIVNTSHSRSRAMLPASSPTRSERIVGGWVRPMPGQTAQGFVLAEDGRIGSIGATFSAYRNWKIENDLLILQGESFDGKTALYDTFRIRRFTGYELSLEHDGKTETYRRTRNNSSDEIVPVVSISEK